MLKLKSDKRHPQGFLEYLFNQTRDLISQIQEMNLDDIERSTLNESFVIYLYRLYEKQIKWSLRIYGYEDEFIKNRKEKNQRQHPVVGDYIIFLKQLDVDIIFHNQEAIDEINNEFRILRNAIVHGEALYCYKTVFEKLDFEKKAFMTGDGYFHPSTDYLLNILQKVKLIVLEYEEILHTLNRKQKLG